MNDVDLIYMESIEEMQQCIMWIYYRVLEFLSP